MNLAKYDDDDVTKKGSSFTSFQCWEFGTSSIKVHSKNTMSEKKNDPAIKRLQFRRPKDESNVLAPV